LVLLLVGGSVRYGDPTIREALRRAHWVKTVGRGMRW
jgi:hypothetical protein